MSNHTLFTVNLKDSTFKTQEIKKHKIVLTDDGTMDTVLKCEDCGEEMRYTFMPDDIEGETYDEFVKWAIEDCEDEHVCLGEVTYE